MLKQIKYMFSTLSNSYNIMGLSPASKAIDIRKKYYELAKLYHPDVNNSDPQAQRKFTTITEAYKLLMKNVEEGPRQEIKDPKTTFYKKNTVNRANQKRQKPATQQQQYQDFHDVDEFFRKGRKSRKAKPGQDIYVNTSISLKESIQGVINHKIQYTRKELCSGCLKEIFNSCFTCGGKGTIYDRKEREQLRCDKCQGRGYENPCTVCDRSGYVYKDVLEGISIEKGTQDKTILKVIGNGHRGYQMGNGDLFVTVFVQPSSEYKVDGNNVHTEHYVDYAVATLGGITKVQTLFGPRQAKIAAGTQSGTQIRLHDAGLKSPYSSRKGDQIVKIKIKIPNKLSEREKQLWQMLQKQQL